MVSVTPWVAIEELIDGEGIGLVLGFLDQCKKNHILIHGPLLHGNFFNSPSMIRPVTFPPFASDSILAVTIHFFFTAARTLIASRHPFASLSVKVVWRSNAGNKITGIFNPVVK